MLLVVGGTGELGGRVVRLLREHGHDVRCLVRDGTDDAALRAVGATVVRGDLTRPDSLPQACGGADTVVATATVLGRRLAGDRTPTIREVDEVGMLSLVGAAEAAGVERFVFVSYAGLDTRFGMPLERAKVAVEERLAHSPLDTVVVRPDAFQEIHLGPLGRFDVAAGRVAVFGKGDTKRRWISTDDVARLVAALAVEPDPPRMVEVGGPEALSRNEAARLAERLTGRRMRVQRMPRALARLGMRLLDRRNDALASVFGTGLHQDLCRATWDDEALRERGIRGRPASEFLREQAQGLR